MEEPQSTDDRQKILFTPKLIRYERFRRGDELARLAFLCLALLNVVLLIVAVVIGLQGAKVRDTVSSLQVSHSASTQLIQELEYLRSNCSDAVKAEEEAGDALQTAHTLHAKLKVQIEQQKTINDNYQRQIEALLTERTHLKSNLTSYEGSCGKCLPGWIFLNSSCYFFSFIESSTTLKNWQDSRADCLSRGADLIVINDQEEQNLTVNYIMKTKDQYDNGAVFWTGLKNFPSEGTWKWVDGSALVRGFWNDREPNNNSDDDCATVFSKVNFLKAWNDVYCRTPLKWICEKAPNPMN